MDIPRKIAYFSMEIGIDADIPTYSGGLGVLAGDTLRSAADLEIPMVAVTLCYNAGYFYQIIDPNGYQIEKEIRWEFASEFERCKKTVEVFVQGKRVRVGAWLYSIIGQSGFEIPVILLDTDIEGNEDWQKQITRVLYVGTPFHRIVQEVILGIGGVKMLKAMGYTDIEIYHMNEGHPSFLTFELLRELGSIERVRRKCIFTTHTPVAAGHDIFPYELVTDIFREKLPDNIREFAGKDSLNMSLLALNMSRYANGVSRKHGEVSRKMFPDYDIDYITNGVHSYYWVSPYLREVYDKTLPGWRYNPTLFKNADAINSTDLWKAHKKAKKALMEYEKSHSWVLLDRKLLTIGFARRITGYKRPTLLFTDIDKLGRLCKGKVQFIFAGKTHPKDTEGKEFIKHIYTISDYLWEQYKLRLVFLENYDMDLAKLLVAGVDVWLNNPRRYLEASGTSGMKAAHNGVINFSVLDGWWIEGYKMDKEAGWSIGPEPDDPEAEKTDDYSDAMSLYSVLEKEIMPLYYNYKSGWIEKMKRSIRLAAYFNTHRMVEEYASKAWNLERQPRWRTKRPAKSTAKMIKQ